MQRFLIKKLPLAATLLWSVPAVAKTLPVAALLEQKPMSISEFIVENSGHRDLFAANQIAAATDPLLLQPLAPDLPVVKNLPSLTVGQLVDLEQVTVADLLSKFKSKKEAAAAPKPAVAVSVPKSDVVQISVIGADQPDKKSTQLALKTSPRTQPVLLAKNSSSKTGPNLSAPEELFSLDDVMPENFGQQSANFLANPKAAKTTDVEGEGDPETDGTDAESDAEDAADDTADEEQNADVETKQRSFARPDTEITYVNAKVQVIDDRSYATGGKIYPVIGVKVTLVGTEFRADTDARGMVHIKDLPANSRFLVLIDDPSGRVKNAVAEIETSDEDLQTFHVQTMRYQKFDTYESVARVERDTEAATLCATLSDDHVDHRQLGGLSVEVDVPASRPHYFNRFGFLDPAQKVSGDDGRVCFFNVEPGPVSVTVYQGESALATFPIAVFTGRHSEEEFYVDDAEDVAISLGATATAHEQLSSSEIEANMVQEIDVIDLIPLGTGSPLTYLDAGIVGTRRDGLHFHNDQTYVLSQAAEFESTMYAVNRHIKDRVSPLVPLLPRGFVEDMALYAQVSYDPALGVVVAEHGELHGQGQGNISVRLIDEDGRDVGEGWYYADHPVTRSIFFNLQPGKYSLLIATEDGYWIAAQTVLVFNETVSYVTTGASMERQL